MVAQIPLVPHARATDSAAPRSRSVLATLARLLLPLLLILLLSGHVGTGTAG